MISNKTKRLLKRARTLESIRRQSMTTGEECRADRTTKTITASSPSISCTDFNALPSPQEESEGEITALSISPSTSHGNFASHTTIGHAKGAKYRNKENTAVISYSVVDLPQHSHTHSPGAIPNHCGNGGGSISKVIACEADIAQLRDRFQLQINIRLSKSDGAATNINVHMPFPLKNLCLSLPSVAVHSDLEDFRSHSDKKLTLTSGSAVSRYKLLRRTRSCFFHTKSDMTKVRQNVLAKYKSVDEGSDCAMDNSLCPDADGSVVLYSRPEQLPGQRLNGLRNIQELLLAESGSEVYNLNKVGDVEYGEHFENLSPKFERLLQFNEIDQAGSLHLNEQGQNVSFHSHQLDEGEDTDDEEGCTVSDVAKIEGAGESAATGRPSPRTRGQTNTKSNTVGNDVDTHNVKKKKTSKKASRKLPSIKNQTKSSKTKSQKSENERKPYQTNRLNCKTPKVVDSLSVAVVDETSCSPSRLTVPSTEELQQSEDEIVSPHDQTFDPIGATTSTEKQSKRSAHKTRKEDPVLSPRRHTLPRSPSKGSRFKTSPRRRGQSVGDHVVSPVLATASVLSRPILPPIGAEAKHA